MNNQPGNKKKGQRTVKCVDSRKMSTEINGVYEDYLIFKDLDNGNNIVIRFQDCLDTFKLSNKEFHIGVIGSSIVRINTYDIEHKKLWFKTSEDKYNNSVFSVVKRLKAGRKTGKLNLYTDDVDFVEGRIVYLDSDEMVVAVTEMAIFVKFTAKDFYINKNTYLTEDFKINDKINLHKFINKEGKIKLRPLSLNDIKKEIKSQIKVGNIYKGKILNSFTSVRANGAEKFVSELYYVELTNGLTIIAKRGKSIQVKTPNSSVAVRIKGINERGIISEIIG